MNLNTTLPPRPIASETTLLDTVENFHVELRASISQAMHALDRVGVRACLPAEEALVDRAMGSLLPLVGCLDCSFPLHDNLSSWEYVGIAGELSDAACGIDACVLEIDSEINGELAARLDAVACLCAEMVGPIMALSFAEEEVARRQPGSLITLDAA